jgi:hypothetical protein
MDFLKKAALDQVLGGKDKKSDKAGSSSGKKDGTYPSSLQSSRQLNMSSRISIDSVDKG